MQSNNFSFPATTGDAVFYRSYSRRNEDNSRESWHEAVKRSLGGLFKLGKYTDEEKSSITDYALSIRTLPSGRWMWVGGTPWVEEKSNVGGAYNCTSSVLDDISMFGEIMRMSMEGSGCGYLAENKFLEKLPSVVKRLNVKTVGMFGFGAGHLEKTVIHVKENHIEIRVGDSRVGWCDAVQTLIDIATMRGGELNTTVDVVVDISWVRPKGKKLKGFGGVSNPSSLPGLFPRLAEILNGCLDRDGRLNSAECCLLIDESAKVVVAGNIRRSALIAQGSSDDDIFTESKQDLWQQDNRGNWKIDPKRDALRMANHTRVFHHKPSLEEVKSAVAKQVYSGEGAIQYAPEAIARGNSDIFPTQMDKMEFIEAYENGDGEEYIRITILVRENRKVDERELEHRMSRYGMNPCFAAGTMVMTREGHFPIESLVGKTVDVWDGNEWVTIDNFRVTGENQDVYKLTMATGEEILATPYHKFVLQDGTKVELRNLKPGDRLLTHDVQIHGTHNEKGAYLKGFMVGDGTTRNGKAALDLYEPKWVCEGKLISSMQEIGTHSVVSAGGRFVPVSEIGFRSPHDEKKTMQGIAASNEDLLPWVSVNRKEFPREILNWDLPSKLEFITGVMDADGTGNDSTNGFMYQITSIHHEWLLGFQELLHTIGVNSSVKLSKKGGLKDFGSRGGVCITQPLYRLSIAQRSSVKLSQNCVFYRIPSFADKVCKNIVKTGNNKVASVEFSHVADKVYCCTVPTNHQVSLSNVLITGQCAEVLGTNFYCNLSEIHLNQLDPMDFDEQRTAFKNGGLIAATLLHHEFQLERQQYSRELDPIVGVSFTGLFDFFVKLFGIRWMEWWRDGRPENWGDTETAFTTIDRFPKMWQGDFDYFVYDGSKDINSVTESDVFKWIEAKYLSMWRDAVETSVETYCQRNGLRVPNRCTVVQPAGSKSLLTGASAGWHPPKAANYIRRITFQKNDPVALAYIDLGYSIVPGQSDKDDEGRLLDDPFDPRCTEWLVEIPVQTPAGKLDGIDDIDINRFSASAQLDFYMQVQKFYTAHNTSATIELREDEIDEFAEAIYKAIQNGDGYISAALLARYDSPFPRLPFEAISSEKYSQLMIEVENRQTTTDFYGQLKKYDDPSYQLEGAAQCDSDKCLFSVK